MGTGLWSHSHHSHAAASSSCREQQDRCLRSVQPAKGAAPGAAADQGVPRHLPGSESQAVGTAGPCWGWPWMPTTRLSLCSLGPTDRIPTCQPMLSPPELTSCSPSAPVPSSKHFPSHPHCGARAGDWRGETRQQLIVRRCSVVSPEESGPCKGTRRQG